MKSESYPIPSKLNLLLSSILIATLLALLWAAGRVPGWWLPAIALGYGLIMKSAYAMLHEAEHGILHIRPGINNLVGVILALFFPAPFHMIRQGHLGHHLRNRSDDEAFDFYFEGENQLWKKLQLYGILTGGFWVVIFLSNIVTVFWPGFLKPRNFSFDRPTEAFLQSLNKRFLTIVWIESVVALLLHAFLIWFWEIPVLNWFISLSGFGILWSAMQYVHHFGTDRDVITGALDLKTWKWLDALWLNHNWHLRHHRQPTIPWIYLPFLDEGEIGQRGNLVAAYIRMWRGPKLSIERVENHYAGRIIR